ncbi:CotH protein [Dyadobacter jejuensis]|uniref:CotH protein n=2 Tax=Dyadobacter jejuensis TaxID=1082580 RepID=A0A316AJF7_9BACT|nr:CotH protein [Dyadobacter jejuensis]
MGQIDHSEQEVLEPPQYSLVFNDEKINTLHIKVDQSNWDAINDNMQEKFGTFGARSAQQGSNVSPVPGGNRQGPPPGGPQGMLPGGGPSGAMAEDPIYVPVDIDFNGLSLNQVGFRLKGNSSLMTSWARGIYKLPFRLNFKKYDKQSLHGFQELSLSPAFNDPSLIREKVASDLFRAAGVPAAQTSFCKVYIDFGDDTQYCGVYTIVEVVDDTMIKNQFGEDDGNIYKPESTFASFTASQFEKKNNKKKADFSDVEQFITFLNAPYRTTEPVRWRQEMEQALNVDGFLKWLAMNTLMVSWDSYGAMAHNYYLYQAQNGQLNWIPWDQNEAMSTQKEGMAPPTQGQPNRPGPPGPRPAMAGTAGTRPGAAGMANAPGRGKQGVDLELKTVGTQWPLIRHMAEDPTYYARYRAYVTEFAQTLFTPERMSTIFDRYYRLLDSAAKEEKSPYSQMTGYKEFKAELKELKQHVKTRQKEALKTFMQ